MKKSPPNTAIGADAAKLKAIEYCLFHYPTLYTGGVPRRDPAGEWIVPIMLEDPDAGISDEVGELRIDAWTAKVLASTPAAAVVAAGTQRYQVGKNGRRPARPSSARTVRWHACACFCVNVVRELPNPSWRNKQLSNQAASPSKS